MLRTYYINKEFIVSPSARRVYRAAAALSFMLCLIILNRGVPNLFLPLARFMVFAGVLGAATTLVAMEYFLFNFDESGVLKKAFWFCVLLLPPLGPPVYCFLVYSRSEAVKACVTHGDQTGFDSRKTS